MNSSKGAIDPDTKLGHCLNNGMEINAQYKDMKIIYSHCLVKKVQVKLFEKYMLIKNLMSSNNFFFFCYYTSIIQRQSDS